MGNGARIPFFYLTQVVFAGSDCTSGLYKKPQVICGVL